MFARSDPSCTFDDCCLALWDALIFVYEYLRSVDSVQCSESLRQRCVAWVKPMEQGYRQILAQSVVLLDYVLNLTQPLMLQGIDPDSIQCG